MTAKGSSLLVKRLYKCQLTNKSCYNSIKAYHSYDHLSSSPYSSAQAQVLSAALKHVPEYGFSKESLVNGCRDQGYTDSTHAGFRNGAFEQVKYHLYIERTKLAGLKAKIDEEEGSSMERKLRRYCVERLNGNIGVLERWPEAIALMVMPDYAPQAIKELAKLSDEILFLSGDKSSEFDWYTRRASLAAVYSATELYMTQDKSLNFEMTWGFLDRRLAEVQKAGAMINGLSTWAGFTAMAGLNVLRSQLVRR
ncbi:COQ9-domain-containing protein [Lipomyces arxii]|uniref:COQ9-domain-containing protein n=1 Tax=Lipomyces arxii TaxID=56418 RepID=UPI0034CE08DC